jgi:hypothetical protein
VVVGVRETKLRVPQVGARESPHLGREGF